jgi:TonB family protein
VDVDSDNGGILLNLSESGLAMQAVAPFAGLTRVNLRIQPPRPRMRIDLHAEIAWLSESKKEAGLQFLELADDVRVEIANWISAEGGARERSVTGDSLTLQTAQVSPAQFPQEMPPRRRKWSSLVENSPSQSVPTNPKIPNELPNPSFSLRNPELHTDAKLRDKFPEIPAHSPDSNTEQIYARTSSSNAPPDDSITFSQNVSGATLPPSIELSPPPPPPPAPIAAVVQACQPAAPAPTLRTPAPAPIVQPPPAPAAELIARRDQTPKTFISSSSEKFPRSGERRRLPRQRIYSLAYLEVGSDNGGMVLDLSEYGLALQAFNPLIDLTRVNLRIQPPKSRKKIVATAQITWLGESQTEAGLRFLDLSEDARMEIADWISAETTAPEPPPVDHSASRQAQIVSSAQPSSSPVTEDRYCNWEESFPPFENSNPKEPLANQNVSRDSPNTSPDEGNVAFQPGSAFSEELSDHSTNDPNHSQRAIGQGPSIANKLTVAPSASSEPVPGGSHPPLKLPAAVTAASRLFDSEQFRRRGTIASLCACVALVFLFLGMAIARAFLSDRATRLSAEEHARAAAASSTPPVTTATLVTPGIPGRIDAPTGPAAFPTEASVSKTRQRDSANVSRPPQKESRDKHNREDPKSRMTSGEADPIAAALPPAIAPSPETTRSASQTVAVPSLPVWSVQAAGNRNLAAATPATNSAPPRVLERRSDCYLLYRVEPLYPREAREQRIEGAVTIRLQIGTDGHVRSSQELSGPAPLVPAALAAVREWRFIPALLNGQPIDTEKDVSIEFQLSR